MEIYNLSAAFSCLSFSNSVIGQVEIHNSFEEATFSVFWNCDENVHSKKEGGLRVIVDD